jgi:RNA polymerase sigma-70 factor (ECF subfamily)
MEPAATPSRVTAVNTTLAAPGGAVETATVADLYAACYARLVGTLTVVAGSHADAEELVQEAFARLLPAWGRVRHYDDPEAWVRQVAFRLATSRWRRARVAARGLVRLGAPPPVPEPDETRLDAERLLAALAPKHREVLVLHHVVGLSVDEIARDLGVPPGTVKSRLARARAAAAAEGGQG